MDPEIEERFTGWVARRAAREPAQHIAGVQEFYGLAFSVGPDVLIPRPETEWLVEKACAVTPNGGTVVDLGTGSGCIAVAVAVERPDLRVRAIDRSGAALVVARSNAHRHGVADRIEFVEGDFAAPPESWSGTADAVVSNPPYVSEDEWAGLEPEVRDHDPKMALVPGPDGLEAYRALLPAAARLLRPGGWLMLEFGMGQAEGVRAIVEACGVDVQAFDEDLNGITRNLTAKLGR